ncbi:MAG: hypothetical protein OEX77_00200 [Candidatus Bathyarchaeota archaeon]|nr:hypothetical protein [Candidatus Bathyarchaeota archaeon]MDH5732233.1 hypothetical protein [Candidatus Bathyarchaeota archaeon]
MRQVVRALGWATRILWVAIIIFGLTVAYSATNLQAGVGQPQPPLVSNGLMTLALPFYINNTGFYSISGLNITTEIRDHNGTSVSTSTTLVPLIPADSFVERTHNISVSLPYMAQNLTYLVFEDSNLTINVLIAMMFAHAVSLQMSANTTLWWGAPLSNFAIGEISADLIAQEMIVPLNFENHSPVYIDGTLRLEIYNGNNQHLGSGMMDVSVPPGHMYDDRLEVSVDVSKLTEKGEVHFYFETSTFSLGPIIMSW